MKFAAKIILLFIVALLTVQTVHASEPYSFRDGYYFDLAGAKYTRAKAWVWVDGYYYWKGCCRYYQDGYWQSNGYTYTQVAAAISYKTPNWRDRLLEIAAAREESDAFLTAVQAMGLTRSVQVPYAPGNVAYAQQSIIQSADYYGLLDVNLTIQQQAAMVRDATALVDRGIGGYVNISNAAMERERAIAEIRAKGQAAALVLQAAAAAPSASFRTQESKTVPALPQPLAQAINLKRQAAIASCIQCHGAKDPQGGYRVELHWTLPPDKQLEVVRRLTLHEDEPKFMPRVAGGEAGKRLAPDLVMEFLPSGDRVKAK